MSTMVIAIWIGLKLTAYGMGLVFLLLAVLWGLIALLIRFDTPPAEPVAARAATKTAAKALIEPDLLAAVVIACRAHRMARRQQAAPEMRAHEPGSLPSRWVATGRTRQNRSWAPRGRYQ
jgi:Na+-transporting methylmalonyl-CoA/oxaloacetate decarboxylase gamma subunit